MYSSMAIFLCVDGEIKENFKKAWLSGWKGQSLLISLKNSIHYLKQSRRVITLGNALNLESVL